MHPGNAVRIGTIGLAALALGGCGMLDNFGGAKKTSPDEFRVVTHAPLAMPPDAELRPPRPGAARPQETPASEQARTLVTGGRTGAPAGTAAAAAARPAPSEVGERALLARAGADKADPNIRGRVNEESRVIASADKGFFDWLIFWQDSPPPGVIVDPVREQQRLREGQASGTPSTGDTPSIQRRKKGFLEGLFGS